jgi:hypothetical protein
MSAPRDDHATPAPTGVRLVVDFATGRIVGAERPAQAPAPPAQSGGPAIAPPERDAA